MCNRILVKGSYLTISFHKAFLHAGASFSKDSTASARINASSASFPASAPTGKNGLKPCGQLGEGNRWSISR